MKNLVIEGELTMPPDGGAVIRGSLLDGWIYDFLDGRSSVPARIVISELDHDESGRTHD